MLVRLTFYLVLLKFDTYASDFNISLRKRIGTSVGLLNICLRSDLSSTTKWDENHNCDRYGFGRT